MSNFGFDVDGNIKCTPGYKYCNSFQGKTVLKCSSSGYQNNNPFATEECDKKPGIKLDREALFECSPDRAGLENKYPCLPLQVFGLDSNLGSFCTSVDPKSNLVEYYTSCTEKSKTITSSAGLAARIITYNPRSYWSLQREIFQSCTIDKVADCKKAFGLLEDASAYVGGSAHESGTPQGTETQNAK